MSNISDKAYVSPKAKIGNNVTIYPFAYIEDDVVIGDNCTIYPYVSIMARTTRYTRTLCLEQSRRISSIGARPRVS